jgi:hypothetical protein
VLACDVAVTVLEYENGRLVNLDGQVAVLRRRTGPSSTAPSVRGPREPDLGADGMVYVCLLACGDATIDFLKDAGVEHLEEDHARARVQHKLGGGPLALRADTA